MWCNVGFAEDISEYEIEGISIGDSLLDHLSKEEIITEIEINKPEYNYLTDEFGEVYLYKNYEKYDYLSFFVRPKDKKYIIYYIGGTIKYDDKIKQCLTKQKEIYKEISSQFNIFFKVSLNQFFSSIIGYKTSSFFNVCINDFFTPGSFKPRAFFCFFSKNFNLLLIKSKSFFFKTFLKIKKPFLRKHSLYSLNKFMMFS